VWSVGPAWEGPRLENLFVIKFAQKEELWMVWFKHILFWKIWSAIEEE
jgi:hypothetical protein